MNTDITTTANSAPMPAQNAQGTQIILPPADNLVFSQDVPEKADLSFQSITRYLRLGYIALFILIAVIGSWAIFSNIQGAVIASGQVAVDQEPQILQHIEGGVISEIYVKKGDFVQANSPVMKLDSTLIDANKIAAQTNYYANEALMSRLLSELEQDNDITWLDTLKAVPDNPAAITAKATQAQLFTARRTALAGQVSQLEQRIAQFQNEGRGIESEINFTQTELNLITPELNKLQRLLARNLVPRARLTDLERQQTRLLNQRGQLQNRRALLAGSIREAQLNIAQLYKARQEETLTLLSEARTRADSFDEALKTAANRTEQVFLRAPTSGFVHKMSIKTIGGVVAKGQEIMQIIPKREKLILTARVLPADIDQVSLGQATNVIFSSLNTDAPPELFGIVKFISPDSLINEVDGTSYFEVEVEVSPDEFSKLGRRSLVPGMPADIFIQTQERSVMQYLLGPLRKTLSRTMRDG